MSKRKKKQTVRVTASKAMAILGVAKSTFYAYLRHKTNPLRYQIHYGRMTFALADLKRYRPNPVGFPRGKRKGYKQESVDAKD